MNLKGVNFAKPSDTSQKDKFYFLLTTVVLTLTGLLIIGACAGSIYFFYKLTFGNRERYFQFDDNLAANDGKAVGGDLELAERMPVNLSKIIEDPDGEANTSVAAKSGTVGINKFSSAYGTAGAYDHKDTYVTSNRSSVVNRVNGGKSNVYDNEYNGNTGVAAGDMSKKS